MFTLHTAIDHDDYIIHSISSLNINESAVLQLENEDENPNDSFEVFDDEMLNPTFLIGNDMNTDSTNRLNGCIS